MCLLQVVTDNASNMRAAGRIIQHKYRHIFWAGCAAHSTDLFLAFIGKMVMVAFLLSNCNFVCKFMLNHQLPNDLLRSMSRVALKRTCETR